MPPEAVPWVADVGGDAAARDGAIGLALTAADVDAFAVHVA